MPRVGSSGTSTLTTSSPTAHWPVPLLLSVRRAVPVLATPGRPTTPGVHGALHGVTPGASKPAGHVHRPCTSIRHGLFDGGAEPGGRLAMLNGVPVAGVAGAGTSSAVAVTTVYVLTSGSGDSYASNGSTSTATRRTGSPRTTTACPGGIGPGGEMADRCPARRLGRPLLATRSGGRRGPASNRRGELRHTRDGERREKLESANKVDRGRPAEHQGGVSQTHRVPKAAGGGPVERETTHGNLGYTIVTFRAELARV